MNFLDMVKRWLECKRTWFNDSLTIGKIYETHRIDIPYKQDEHKYNVGYRGRIWYYSGWHLGSYYIIDDNGERHNLYVTGADFKNKWKEIKREKLNYCTNPDPFFKKLLSDGTFIDKNEKMKGLFFENRVRKLYESEGLKYS